MINQKLQNDPLNEESAEKEKRFCDEFTRLLLHHGYGITGEAFIHDFQRGPDSGYERAAFLDEGSCLRFT